MRAAGRAAFTSLCAQVERCEAQLRALETQRGKKTSIRKRQAMKLALENKLAGLQGLIDHRVKILRQCLTGLLVVRTQSTFFSDFQEARTSDHITPFSLRPLSLVYLVCVEGCDGRLDWGCHGLSCRVAIDQEHLRHSTDT